MKESGEQYDGRIVEVTWDAERQGWRMFRFRDDKPHGNHRSTVAKVLQSIGDGVEMDAVLNRQDAIRAAWKQRDAQRRGSVGGSAGPPNPLQQQQQRAPPLPPPAGQAVMAGLKR